MFNVIKLSLLTGCVIATSLTNANPSVSDVVDENNVNTVETKPKAVWIWSKQAFQDLKAGKYNFVSKQYNDQENLRAKVMDEHLQQNVRTTDTYHVKSNSTMKEKIANVQKVFLDNLGSQTNSSNGISGLDQ